MRRGRWEDLWGLLCVLVGDTMALPRWLPARATLSGVLATPPIASTCMPKFGLVDGLMTPVSQSLSVLCHGLGFVWMLHLHETLMNSLDELCVAWQLGTVCHWTLLDRKHLNDTQVVAVMCVRMHTYKPLFWRRHRSLLSISVVLPQPDTSPYMVVAM